MSTTGTSSSLAVRSPMLRLAVLVTALSMAVTAAAAQGKQVSYRLFDIGTLPGKLMSYVQPNGLNDRGQVTGWSYVNHYEDDVPFVWDKGAMTGIADLFAGPQGINNPGQVVGVGLASVGGVLGLHAFLFTAGNMVFLPDPGDLGWASDINSRGTIVGFGLKFGDSGIPARYLPLLWQDGAFQQLPALAVWPDQVDTGVGNAVNEAGEIAGASGGWYTVGSDPPTLVSVLRATLWRHGQPVDLGTLSEADTGSMAYDINNAGVVVGSSGTSSISLPGRPFVWTSQSGMIALPMPEGFVSGVPQGINNRGQIVGIISELEALYAGSPPENGEGPLTVPFSRAVLWQDGQCIDLNTVLPPDSPWTLFRGVSINARGQILVMAARLNDPPDPKGLGKCYILHPLLLDPTN